MVYYELILILTIYNAFFYCIFLISYVIKFVLTARTFRQQLKNPTMVWVADTQKRIFLAQIITQSKCVIQLGTFLLDFWGCNTYSTTTGSRRKTVILKIFKIFKKIKFVKLIYLISPKP